MALPLAHCRRPCRCPPPCRTAFLGLGSLGLQPENVQAAPGQLLGPPYVVSGDRPFTLGGVRLPWQGRLRLGEEQALLRGTPVEVVLPQSPGLPRLGVLDLECQQHYIAVVSGGFGPKHVGLALPGCVSFCP